MADPFIGEVRLFGFNFNPRGWYRCEGTLLPIATNATLFSLLGTFYGSDGRTTFALPDLRGRAAIAKGRHSGSLFDWRMGQIAGAEEHTLSLRELTTHDHAATFTTTGVSLLEVEVSTSEATSDIPAEGSYLAATPPVGRNPGQFMYIPNTSVSAQDLVSLGGVSGGAGHGSVTVGSNGGNGPFSLLQPVQVLNYSIADTGIYPPRS